MGHYVNTGDHNSCPTHHDAILLTGSSGMSLDQGRSGVLGASSSLSGHLPGKVGSWMVNVHHCLSSPDPFMAPASVTVDMNNHLTSALENDANGIRGW